MVLRQWLLVFLGWLALTTFSGGAELRSGIDQRGIDATVRPQDDLFVHANGEWLKHTPIPADKSNYGSFTILYDQAQTNIRDIIAEALESDSPPGSDEQKIGDFFQSYMDEAQVEQLGISPMLGSLARINSLESLEQLLRYFGSSQVLGVQSPIAFYVDQDDKNSSEYLAVLKQSGISLPDRDYYLETDEKYASAREAMKIYITRLFELSELAGGERAAVTILAIETELARAQWTRTQLRDAEKRYNKVTIAELEERAPDIPWHAFLAGTDVMEIAELNLSTPSFFQELSAILKKHSLEDWRQYLRFQLISEYAQALPQAYVDANFAFYGQELGGLEELKPRWKRAVSALAGDRGFGVLGDVVGRLYVERHYPEVACERMDVLIDNLMKAYEDSIDELKWMTPDTKERALEKLMKINTKIGHTEKWRDYSKLEIQPDDLVGNRMRSARVEYLRMTSKLGLPVDRQEWYMTPQTVNAYYNPGLNEIVFPAGILQPPYFDFEADDAANYGSIGSIIGHEISHAFDDQGSKYDGDGNLKNWWTEQDRAAFRALTAQLVEQYDAYSPLEGKRVNGELTLGENIADLSGMSVAFKAYQLALAGEKPPTINGWSGKQRFFLGWGQSWRRKYRDAEMVKRLKTDPHSPAMYRGNGPLTNFDPFYRAFNLKPGDRLFRSPTDRIRIW